VFAKPAGKNACATNGKGFLAVAQAFLPAAVPPEPDGRHANALWRLRDETTNRELH
jgi:hypothetical protein